MRRMAPCLLVQYLFMKARVRGRAAIVAQLALSEC